MARSKARIGLVDRDGLIATFSSRLSRDLGFDAPEDLRGLCFASLWHPADRPAVERAFVAALRGRAEGADVDMAYVQGATQPAHVTFAPGQAGGAVLMTFDWNARDGA
ncbi:PAS domain-containing protein [Jannaschia formosa]|uniref:PAS domain-containing protein n=1 Tax=Jannaschia formosa TaxID=2259592 RepID=UPI000E1BB9E9|nr:PAS domain-containing protein [Jannaschia formosa]